MNIFIIAQSHMWASSCSSISSHGIPFLKKKLFLTMPIVKNFFADIAKSKHKLPRKPTRPPGGGRPLTDMRKVFEYNNWDNVDWDDEQEADARNKVATNSASKVDAEMQDKYESEAGSFWDNFYSIHQNRFFKDRHWLFTEFPELAKSNLAKVTCDQSDIRTETSTSDFRSCDNEQTVEADGKKIAEGVSSLVDSTASSLAATNTYPGHQACSRIFEVGCGVGNTVFPVLRTNNDGGLFVYCCDLSDTAIHIVKEHPDYTADRCHAFVCDVTDPEAVLPFPEGSLDLVVLIFVLSAVHPEKMSATVKRLASCLKPGGHILFRDYGRYDLTQLRFKDGQCLTDNFYVRGDGTRVYFFTQDELRELFTSAGLEEKQNLIDRRLQVNRGRQLKMYRVWLQCKYRKPSTSNT